MLLHSRHCIRLENSSQTSLWQNSCYEVRRILGVWNLQCFSLTVASTSLALALLELPHVVMRHTVGKWIW